MSQNQQIVAKRITGKCIQCSKRTQGRHQDQFCCRSCKHKQIHKSVLDTLENLTSFDLGWLVGLIEGEGCFYRKDSKSNLQDGTYVYPLCGFAMMATDKDVMRRASDLLDIDLKGPYYKQQENERKVVWSIQVTGNKAVALMKSIYNYLGNRRKKQIDAALQWQSRGRFKLGEIK